MTLYSFCSPKRFLHIMKLDFFSNLKAFILPTSAIFGIMFALLFISGGESNFVVSTPMFILLLYITGYRLSSRSFADIHHPTHSISFFMIPASQFEKFLSRLLLTSIVFLIFSVLSFFLFSLIIHGIAPLLWKKSIPIFNPFLHGSQSLFDLKNPDMLQIYFTFIVTQSIFLTGSIFFKNHPMSKTFIFIILINFGLSILMGILTSLFHWEILSNLFNLDPQTLFPHWSEVAIENIPTLLQVGTEIIFYGILAPVLWTLAYFRLKKTQVQL